MTLNPKIKYLTNKDLLREIHNSKNTFCSFEQPSYKDYDIIVTDINNINDEVIAEAKQVRAIRLAKEMYETAQLTDKKATLKQFEIDPTSLSTNDIVIRVMTFDHVPAAPGRKKTIKNTADKHEKINFPPFQHWKFDNNNALVCVGKSHWKGPLTTGKFCKTHGQMTNSLAHMFLKLCDRYATKGNVRGYCVDTETEALTKRGWVGIDEISEKDTILSYANNNLQWSKIRSIYRGEYQGLMHHITSRSVDFLITPEHKLVTTRGLVKAELIKKRDKIVVMGNEVIAPTEATYLDSFVELAGWIMTEGCYQKGRKGQVGSISIYQNPTVKADRIRKCLTDLAYTFAESGSKNLCFRINAENTRKITEVFPTKNLTMEFILALTQPQRELLINTMIDGDGWRRGNNMSYCQKNKEHVDLFQALLAISGRKSNYHFIENHPSFNKTGNYYSINIFSKRGNRTNGECLNFNGGFNNGTGINRGKGKEAFLNIPTVPYNGRVWCPETEYGCFVARRNGKVYLTGNTYNEEMKGQAILQLTQIGLQFDESKSSNPFAYYTAAVTNSFVRVLNIEKRNQNMRDDILEINGMNPSWTRQNSGPVASISASSPEV